MRRASALPSLLLRHHPIRCHATPHGGRGQWSFNRVNCGQVRHTSAFLPLASSVSSRSDAVRLSPLGVGSLLKGLKSCYPRLGL